MQPTSRDEPATDSTPPAPTHALVLGSQGAGWTSVEALDPATGLVLWAYEPHRELNAVAAEPGVVFVALSVSHRTDRRQPVSIVALRARDGSRLWWTNTGRVEPRLRWRRLLVGLRIAFGQLNLRNALWTMRSMRLGGDNTSLATDGNVLCVCAESTLLGLDARSGKLRWISPSLNGQRREVLAIRNGGVLVTGNRDYAAGGPGLEALDALTGRVLWRYRNAPPASETIPAANDERVYMLVNLAPARKPARWAIVTLSVTDGTPQHLYPIGGHDRLDTLRLISDDGVAYFVHEGQLYAVQLADERELWRMNPFERGADDTGYPPLDLSLSTGPSPVLAYSYVYRAPADPSGSGRVGALGPHTGATLWRWDSQPGPRSVYSWLRLTAAHDSVYISAVDGMHALSAADGRELWHVPHGFPSARDPVLVALDG